MPTALVPDVAARARRRRSSAIRDILDVARRPEVISLAGGLPSADLLPVARIREAIAAIDRDALQYGPTQGEERLRNLLAGDADPSRIVVTTGSQQGLSLLATTLLDPGDVAVVAQAEYLGAIQSLGEAEADLVPIPSDHDGLDVDALADRLAAGLRPKLVYVVAHFHNPTGATLTRDRRRRLVALAERYGFVIAEDDPYRELWFEHPPLPAVGAGSDHVVALRSVSKTLAPGLRLGWLDAPPWLVPHLVVAKQAADLHTSSLSQALAVDLLADDRWLAEHLREVRARYRRQRDALLEALASTAWRSAAGDTLVAVPAGGMFVWLDLPGIDTARLLPRAIDHGVAFVPGTAFSPTGTPSTNLRLTFATATVDQLHDAVDRLATAIAAERAVHEA